MVKQRTKNSELFLDKYARGLNKKHLGPLFSYALIVFTIDCA